MAECYICAESDPPPLSGLCACTDRYIHAHCQKRLVETIEKNAKCSICKTQYKNARVVEHRQLNFRYFRLFVLMGGMFGFVSIGLILVTYQSILMFRVAPRSICLFDYNYTSHTNFTNEIDDSIHKNKSHDIEQFLCVSVRNVAIYSVIAFICLTSFVVGACVVGMAIIRRNFRTEIPHFVTHQVYFDVVCANTPAPDAASPDEACTEISGT